MEMFDIEDDGIQCSLIRLCEPSDVFKEELVGIQTGQRIGLRAIDEALLLVEIDDPLAACEDHLRHAVWLLDEIVRAAPDARDLSVALLRHDDHRDPRECRIRLAS